MKNIVFVVFCEHVISDKNHWPEKGCTVFANLSLKVQNYYIIFVLVTLENKEIFTNIHT